MCVCERETERKEENIPTTLIVLKSVSDTVSDTTALGVKITFSTKNKLGWNLTDIN